MAGKTLTATFKAVDNMSSALDKMANSGNKMLANLDKIRNVSADAMGKVTALEDSFVQAGNATYQWTEKLENYNKDAMLSINSIEELVNEGYLAETTLDDLSESEEELTENLDKMGKEAEDALADLDKFGKGNDKASEKVRGLSDESENTSEKISKSFETASDALAALGIVKFIHTVTDELIECSEAAMTYETSLATVSTIADTSEMSMGEISAGIRENAVDVATYSSAYAEAVYSAISASVDTVDSVSFVSDATKLAVGGFTSATTAVDVLTTALNSYGLETSETAQISDYLVMTQNLGKTTVDQLASSVGKVIPLASAYNVQMDNLSANLALMTANGIATAEAVTYTKAMLTELGDSGSEVSKTLQDKTGMSFSALMQQGYSLGDVLQVLGDSVNGNATAFSNLWSSTEAGIGALSLYNSGAEKFNSVLAEMRNSTGATEKAFQTMSDTTAYAKEQMNVAADMAKSSIGDAINPALKEMYSSLASSFQWISAFSSEHPNVVKGVIAITAGVGAFTVAMTALTAIEKYHLTLKAAIKALDLLNPTKLAIAAVSALAAVIGTGLVLALGNAEESYYSLTAESQKNYDKLQELTEEYDKAAEIYGETSSQALSLKYQVEELTATYENSKQTVKEYDEAFNKELDSLRESRTQRAERIQQVESEAGSVIYLSQRLDELMSVRRRTNEEEQEVLNIVSQLNSAIPTLSLTYDTYTHSLNMTTDAVMAYAEAQAKQKLIDVYQENYSEAYGKVFEFTKKRNEANAQLTASEAQLQKAMSTTGYQAYNTALKQHIAGQISDLALAGVYVAYKKEVDAVSEAQEAVNVYRQEVEDSQNAINEAKGEIEDYNNAVNEISGFSLDAAESTGELTGVTSEMQNVISSTCTSVSNLCKAYNAAYTEALESVQGQYNLWDNVEKVTATSTDNIIKNINSQIDYWTTYSDNLDKLNEKSTKIEGLNEVLNKLNDGSEESAAVIAGLANASDAQLEKVVAQYKKLSSSQEEVSKSMAETKTDFFKQLDDIQTKMEGTVEKLNLDDEAQAAASKTMNAYINEIRTKGATAVTQAQSIAMQISAALNPPSLNYGRAVNFFGNVGRFTNQFFNAFNDGSNALGLSYVPYDGYISELHKGEAVLNADEAEIWRSASNATFSADVPITTNENHNLTESKKITIEIAGSGSIIVEGSVTRERIQAIVDERIAPQVIALLEREIIEESDGYYEF